MLSQAVAGRIAERMQNSWGKQEWAATDPILHSQPVQPQINRAGLLRTQRSLRNNDPCVW
jgi:hypothetical protein